jgi:heme-degrading monooxygenase HmoA
MILRVFHVTVHEGMASEFEEFFRTIALPLVRSQDGLMSVVAGKPREDAPNIFCMTMVWESVDALKGFAGENWTQARIEPEEEHLIASTSVAHYDLIGTSGDLEV